MWFILFAILISQTIGMNTNNMSQWRTRWTDTMTYGKVINRQIWSFSLEDKKAFLIWERHGEFKEGKSPCLEKSYKIKGNYWFSLKKIKYNVFKLILDKKNEEYSNCATPLNVKEGRLFIYPSHYVIELNGEKHSVYPQFITGVWEWNDFKLLSNGDSQLKKQLWYLWSDKKNNLWGWYDTYEFTYSGDGDTYKCNNRKEKFIFKRIYIRGNVYKNGVIDLYEIKKLILDHDSCGDELSSSSEGVTSGFNKQKYKAVLEGNKIIVTKNTGIITLTFRNKINTRKRGIK